MYHKLVVIGLFQFSIAPVRDFFQCAGFTIAPLSYEVFSTIGHLSFDATTEE